MSEAKSNQLSVRLELQADFYAGMFARNQQGKNYLEAGDLQEALGAATACKNSRKAMSSQIRSRTAVRSNECKRFN